jgi:DNA-binding MarR family transcriptional regulator
MIRRLNQLSTHVFATRVREAGFDLTPVQFAAMDAVLAEPGLDQASIAARIAYDRATIGGVIDRLEQKGYVLRSVSKRDRRAREVRLSEAGRAAYDHLLPIVAALQSEMLQGLEPGEREAFLRLAAKALQAGGEAAGAKG